METLQWNSFLKTKERFLKFTKELSDSLPNLKNIQQEFANNRSGGKNSAYIVQTPVVYNSALDDITIDDDIKLILAADNPGRREQESKRYLIGPSGKIADKFFINNPELGIDFKKNVIILNKTPVHSPRTVELRDICRLEKKSRLMETALTDSQKEMASLLLEFHETFYCPVWITGYSEMRKGGIFETYTESLKYFYKNRKKLLAQLFIFRHFSMNQFTIDLKQQALKGESVKASLRRIGKAYRARILALE